ncbi:MAG: integrase [SAR86 cluster bacterium]|uniref:Integrase n=1 Tax=SAR86 cluster bacterium TaxID=2030880 RepID=A0A2A5CIQ3_9GAMM|nr:MAG: integrase [SAR86 cluster bacterium]
MRRLNYELKELCKHNRDGSFAVQANRKSILQKVANDLFRLGYQGMQARSLKAKHVNAIVEQYKNEGLSIGTIKNRLAILRWWAQKFNRAQVVASDNAHYGIGSRELVAKESKATFLEQEKLDKITDPHIKMSLELQKAFGLRREESIKFIPDYADQGDHIRLKSTWCKGGKERVIPILTQEQREVLNRSKALAGKNSLIPAYLTYVQQKNRYEKQAQKAGLNRMHGLRHAYAQARYLELTGRNSPACGGLSSKQLTPDQKENDLNARLIISKELGHEREQITTSYLGR